MKILVACEFSGIVREAFAKLGHDAWSCDLLPSEIPGQHIQGDVLSIIDDGWDMMIAHPPCTYLCGSGLHWNNRGRGWEQTEKAIEFVKQLMNAPIERIAVENPIGIISSRIRKADQYIQPYEYGHDASKKTGLWLKGLPKLTNKPSDYIQPRMIDGKPRWGNQTDSGQNKLAPSKDRWAQRSKTYQGIADAMANQWGFLETTI